MEMSILLKFEFLISTIQDFKNSSLFLFTLIEVQQFGILELLDSKTWNSKVPGNFKLKS